LFFFKEETPPYIIKHAGIYIQHKACNGRFTNLLSLWPEVEGLPSLTSCSHMYYITGNLVYKRMKRPDIAT
jgi:hypothetical protein